MRHQYGDGDGSSIGPLGGAWGAGAPRNVAPVAGGEVRIPAATTGPLGSCRLATTSKPARVGHHSCVQLTPSRECHAESVPKTMASGPAEPTDPSPVVA